MTKDRLDKILVDRGLAATPRKAQAMIMAGLVFGGEERLDKPGRMIFSDQPLTVHAPLRYVGRGGLKLDEALDVFKIDVEGRICADIGASTGGFTDCLLQRGAAKIYAVDVDIKQLDYRLHGNSRVARIEKNARYLVPGDFSEVPTLVVMDVSFISVLNVIPALIRILEAPGKIGGQENRDTIPLAESNRAANSEMGIVPPIRPMLLSLIKPQFEARKERIGKKGLVRDPSVHREVLVGIARGAADLGLCLRGFVRCSTRGQKGNQEFFGLWSIGGSRPSQADAARWIEDVLLEKTSPPA